MRLRRLGWLGMLWLPLCAGCGGGFKSSTTTVDNAPGAGIFGKLLDQNSQPVVNATVQLRDSANNPIGPPVQTDENGDFDIDLDGLELPDEGELHFTPEDRPGAQAKVEIPHGAKLEVLVTLSNSGGVTVVPLLQAPAGAPVVRAGGREVALVQLNSAGRSAPFRLTVRGEFDPAQNDVRLIYRTEGGGGGGGGNANANWRLSPDAPRQAGTAGITLMLGERRDDLHGMALEVRAAAAPAGRFAGVDEFDQPLRIGHDVVVSPEPVRVVPVATQAERLTGEGIDKGALVVPGAAAATAELRAADLAALGLTAGADAVFRYHGRNVTLRLAAGTAPVLSLATLRLAESDAMHLGLELGRRMAGYEVRIEQR